MATNDKQSSSYRKTAATATGARGKADTAETGGPRCFFWVFAVTPDKVPKLGIDLSSAVKGTPPPIKGRCPEETLKLRPMQALDVNMQHLVFVESKLFCCDTPQESYDAAQAFVGPGGDGKHLKQNCLNAVLYQFAVGTAAVVV